MNEITIKSYAKINLSIDVIGKRPDGYHQVLMVMQQIDLFDFITIEFEGSDENQIDLTTNLSFLPTDNKNIAFKAALLMAEKFPKKMGKITIKISKNIPVAAGLAGGSGNGAAVLHGLNKLWELDLSLNELMELGTELGADVPFCILGQASLNDNLDFIKKHRGEENVLGTCAIASGIGEKLEVIPPFWGWVLLSKPPVSVSTVQVYKNLKLDKITEKPNTEELVQGLKEKNYYKIKKNMINALENVSLLEYPSIVYTKNMMDQACKNEMSLMSGSGPTVFALFQNKKKAKIALKSIEKVCNENYLVKALSMKL